VNTASPRLFAAPGRVARIGATLAGWHRAIASLGPGPWKWAALIGLFGCTLECALILGELDPKVPISALPPVAAHAAICWTVQMTLGLCAWAIVDRSAVAPEQRPARLAIALAVAVLLQAVIVLPVSALLVGPVDPCVLHGCEGKDWSKVPRWLLASEDSGHMLIFGGLIYAWLEVHHRNREIEQRLLASQQERSQLMRTAFDARLTAMRAQVDPQFLFDSLADVQAAYATDTPRGAATLDRLIAYLRTALPRLRTEGSTIGAEAELVGAWLGVLAARRGGYPAWSDGIDSDCAGVPFPATILLPLVQWAVAEPGQPACAVSLTVQRLAGGDSKRLQGRLRVQPGRACGDDEPAPRRVRERLQALYGEASALSCHQEQAPEGANPEASAPATVITVTWPDESADRDHR